MREYPQRDRNHIIETLSRRYAENQFPASWILNGIAMDYGTDYNCEITSNGSVIGNNFSIQLKGKEKDKNIESVKVVLKRSNINRWLKKLEPTMIVVYIVEENQAYWNWIEDNTFDLTQEQKSFTFTIPRCNKLAEINWDLICGHVSKIFSRRHLLYKNPELNTGNKLAWQYYFDKNYQKALPLFYELIEKKPLDASLLQAAALCEYALFNYQKALIGINKALEIEYDESFCLNKASILTEQGIFNGDESKIKDALALYEQLELSGYSSYALFYNFGSALSKINEYEKSIYYYKKAIFVNSNKAEVWNNLGNAYMNLGKHSQEMDCYNKALMIKPNLAETLFSKGSSIFRYFGLIDEGLSLMLQATENTSRHEIDNPYVFFWIAEAYLMKYDFQSAINWNGKGLVFFSSDEYLLTQKARIIEIKELLN